jgi:uncharacterized protein YjiS (DUF1127 family)
MQFEKQFSGDRSSLTVVKHRDQRAMPARYAAAELGLVLVRQTAASGSQVRPHRQIDRPLARDWLSCDDRALRTASERDLSWRAISAAVSALMTRGAAGLAVCSEVAFPNVLFAVVSWTMAQALAGCAAYAEAMYPGFVEHVDRRGPLREAESGNPEQLPGEMPSIAKHGIGGAGPISLPRQTPSGALPVEAGCMARSEGAQAAAAVLSGSITSLIGKFRSRMRRERDRRLAMAELRALDDRSLRDIGISRSDIEYFARRGDRCE